MQRLKVALLYFVALTLVAVSPVVLNAGSLQEKIQQRINAPSNIGIQYEPYYSAENEDSYEGKGSSLTGDYDTKRRKSDSRHRAEVAKSPAEALIVSPIISSYAVYRTDYAAEIEENVVTVEGKVVLEVFRKGYVQIPLVSTKVGLIDVSANRGTAFVTMQAGKYYLVLDRPGRYSLDIEFLIKASREREGGPGSFNFEVIPAPISQFEFTMPETDVQIFVDPSIKTEIKTEAKKTVAWAVMPNTNNISVRWTKALPKETITPVKLEPKIYADTGTYASIGEGLIRCQTKINYSILQSEVSNLRIALPEDVSILEVKGRDLRDWKASNKEGLQYLDVYLNFGVKGNYALDLTYERKIGEGSVVADIPSVRTLDVEREKGYFGLAAATNVELAANKIEHATLIDVKELPSTIWGRTANPILLAFKYLKHPFSITIDVTRHEEVPVIVAAIDSADYITLFTEEGKSLTKAVYQMRNNVKQFIRLVLPEEATLWSVFVSGKPVKPAKDKDGNILIPLEKSQYSAEGLAQFPVEIVYLDKASKMHFLGNIKLHLPQADIPISLLNWSVYFPLDYAYFNFGGDVKPIERTGRGIPFRSVVGMQKQAMVMKEEERREDKDWLGLSQVSPGVQTFYDEVQSVQMKGVLPIRINIPQQGQLFRFSKLLVTEKESPWLSTVFLLVFKQHHVKLWWFLFVIIVAWLIKKIFFKKKAKLA